jgi:carboxyl-terminal processing protease
MNLRIRHWLFALLACGGLLAAPLATSSANADGPGNAGEPAAAPAESGQPDAQSKPPVGKPNAAPNETPAKPDASNVSPKDSPDKTKSRESDYELYKLLIDTLDQVDRNYVTDVNRREMIESAIRGVLNKLDPYSSFMGPDEVSQFRANLAGEFGGIGIQIAVDDGQLKVLSPMFDTPAYKAGILAGDRILEIDGRSTDGVSSDEAVKRLQGDIGQPVTLTIAHPGKDTTDKIKIVREKIHLETLLGDRRGSDGAWQYMLDPKQRIGYIRLTAFSSDSAPKLKKILEQLQKDKMRGLILDLRFNPGGLLNAAIEVSDFFVSEGRIVSTKGRNSPERAWDAHKEGTFTGFSMAVLVNRYSASASEIVAACLQDHGRAVVIGERSWGKGSVQNVIEMDDGKSILKLTTAAYRRPNGKNIHRFPDSKPTDEWGVMPDKGFDMELDDSEMLALIEDRRERDVLRLPTKKNSDRATEKTAAAVEDVAKTGEPQQNEGVKKDAKKNVKKRDQDVAKDGKEGSGPFVDRQLQAALKYLTTELAKAK